MNFLSKIRKNKLLKNALKSANDPIWFVEYETHNGTTTGEVKVYARNSKEAVKNAKKKLNAFEIEEYRITNISAV